MVLASVSLNMHLFDEDDDTLFNYCLSILKPIDDTDHYESLLSWRENKDERRKRRSDYLLSEASKLLPCASKQVEHPIDGEVESLSWIVMDLNDGHKWSREKIADWLDKLHDDGTLDLSFADRTEETEDCQTERLDKS
jgi:hypothetical protein